MRRGAALAEYPRRCDPHAPVDLRTTACQTPDTLRYKFPLDAFVKQTDGDHRSRAAARN